MHPEIQFPDFSSIGLAGVTIGITVCLPNFAFEAEINRGSLSSTIAGIDRSMTDDGVSADISNRLVVAMHSVIENTEFLATGECKDEDVIDDALTDIAFGFFYTFAKEHGMPRLIELRGVVGMMENDRLVVAACVDAESFKRASDAVKEIHEQIDEKGSTKPPVTYH